MAPNPNDLMGADQDTGTPVPQSGNPPTPAPAQPSGPATAPASILPPSRTSQTHGVLSGMILGGMAAAAGVAKKTGQAVGQRLSNFAANSPRGQEIRQAAFNRYIQTQQQQREQMKSMDEHQAAILDNNMKALDVAHKVVENQHFEQLYKDQDEEDRLKLLDMHRAQNKADADFATDLAAAGINVDTSHGAGHENLTEDHAKSIANGTQGILSNGKIGDEAGYGFISNQELQNSVLPHDMKIVTDWNLDPKTDTLTPVYSTLKGGENTAWDAYIGHAAGMTKFNQLQEVATKNMAVRAQQAGLAKDIAEAQKDQAEARKALFESGVGAGDPNLAGDAYVASLPPTMQDTVRGLLRYQVDPTSLGRAQNRQIMIAAAVHGDPNANKPNRWSQAQYKERYDFLNQWGNTQKGAGATRDRINTAVGHLGMLAQASDALNNQDLPKLSQIANSVGVAVGQTPAITYNAIAQKAAAEAAAAQKGGGAAPTDPEIENTLKQFDANMGYQQRMANIQAQFGLIRTQVNTLDSHFQEVMGGSTPEDFGQPTLFPQNAAILQQGAKTAPRQVPPGGQPIMRGGQTVGYILNGQRVNF